MSVQMRGCVCDGCDTCFCFPRRKELLEKAGLFLRKNRRGEEKISSEIPEEVVQELSEAKARQTAQQMAAQTKEDTLVIGADTIVVYHGQILGKPEDEADAVKTLAMLQGNTHQVYTGVTLLRKQEIPGKDIPLRNVRMSLSILYPRKKSEIMFPQAIRWIRREVMEYRPFWHLCPGNPGRLQ